MTDIFIRGVPLPVPHPHKIVYYLPDTPDVFSMKTKTIGEKMTELLSQTYPHYVEPGSNFVANLIEFVLYGILAAGTAAILYLGYLGASAISRYFKGKR